MLVLPNMGIVTAQLPSADRSVSATTDRLPHTLQPVGRMVFYRFVVM
jgi:hypothetical protein